MKKRFIYLILTLGLSLGPFAWSADTAALMKQCNDCHGDAGVSQWDDVPTIAGLAEFVHADALLAYKEKARPCVVSDYRQGDTQKAATDMCTIVKPISEQEIEGLAKAYAALTYTPAKQPFDSALAATGKAVHEKYCDRCHSDGGMNAEDEAGMLGGQRTGYLSRSFEEFAAGAREQPKKMKEKMDLLCEADIEALLNYYASLQ